jgi:hypothetical protein
MLVSYFETDSGLDFTLSLDEIGSSIWFHDRCGVDDTKFYGCPKNRRIL